MSKNNKPPFVLAVQAKDIDRCLKELSSMERSKKFGSFVALALRTFQPPDHTAEFSRLCEWIKENGLEDVLTAKAKSLMLRGMTQVDSQDTSTLDLAIGKLKDMTDRYLVYFQSVSLSERSDDSPESSTSSATIPGVSLPVPRVEAPHHQFITDLLKQCERNTHIQGAQTVFDCLLRNPHTQPSVLDICLMISILLASKSNEEEQSDRADQFQRLFNLFDFDSDGRVLSDECVSVLSKRLSSVDSTEILCDCATSDLNGTLDLQSGNEGKTQSDEKLSIPLFEMDIEDYYSIIDDIRSYQITGLSAGHASKGADHSSAREVTAQKAYDNFVTRMERDGGAQVIVDGANVGHLLGKSKYHTFFLTKDVVRHLDEMEWCSKSLIVYSKGRWRGLDNIARSDRHFRRLRDEWQDSDKCLVCHPELYDDALWLHTALHSAVIQRDEWNTPDSGVLIVTNDTMRDHLRQFGCSARKTRLLKDFLQTHVCRIEVDFDHIFDHRDYPLEWAGPSSDDSSVASDVSRKRKLSEMHSTDDQSVTDESPQQSSKRVRSNHGSSKVSHFAYFDKFKQESVSAPFTIFKPCRFTIKPHLVSSSSNCQIWMFPRFTPLSQSDLKSHSEVALFGGAGPEQTNAVTGKQLLRRVRWFIARVRI